MSSPAGSDHTNSFEDAENGNNAGDRPVRGDPPGEGNPNETGGAEDQQAQGAAANAGTGSGISKEDLDLWCFLQGDCVQAGSNSDRDDRAGPLVNLVHSDQAQQGMVRYAKNAEDEGIGASSTDGQSGQGSLSSNHPDSSRVSSAETSPPAGGVAKTQDPPAPTKTSGTDRPPNQPTKSMASQPQSLGGYGSKGAEPVMAVGVENQEIDTSSLVGGGAGLDPDATEADAEGGRRGPAGDPDGTEANVCRGHCCFGCCRPVGDPDGTGADVCSGRFCFGCLSRFTPLLSCTFCSVGLLMVFSILLSVFYFFLVPFVNSRIKESLILRPGLKGWENTDAQIWANFYMFNVTNPDGFSDDGEIPHLRQVGPYSYRLDMNKINVTWNDNGTVTYRERLTYHFDVNRSVGSEDDVIWTANVPFMVVDEYFGPAKFLEGWFLSSKARQVLETHTVKELLKGYESPVLKEIKTMVNRMPVKFFHLAKDMSEIKGAIGQDNSTVSRVFNVYTGADNLSRLNDVYSWDYQRKLPYWPTEKANAIRGTDGTIFKPFLDSSSNLVFFCSRLFRTFDLEYQQARSYRGLNTLRFIIPDSQFSNSTFSDGAAPKAFATSRHTATASASTRRRGAYTPSQALTELSKRSSAVQNRDMSREGDRDLVGDRYSKSIEDDKATGNAVYNERLTDVTTKTLSHSCVSSCFPSGIYSIEPCVKAPLYISLPHFLGADPFYLSQISGLEPHETKHRPIWDVDSVTGVIVSNRRRYQINAKVNAGKSGETILPIMWMDVQTELDDASLERLLTATRVKFALSVLLILTIGIIAALFIISSALIVFNITGAENKEYRPVASRSRTGERRPNWCCSCPE